MLFIGFIIISIMGISFIFLFWSKPSVPNSGEHNSDSVSERSNNISAEDEVIIVYDEPSNIQAIELNLHNPNTVNHFREPEKLDDNRSSEENSYTYLKTNSIINPFNF